VATRIRNDRLRRAREEHNLTQEELAREIGTSPLTVSRWELGVQTPQPHYREKLCTLFTLSPQELGLIQDRPALTVVEAPERYPGAARARQDLVAQVRRYWVGTELEAATGRLPRLDLALSERPSAVDDPVRVLPRNGEPDRRLPSGTTIVHAYRRAGEQLLVLGNPGGGKTTLLLELASDLLASPLGSYAPMPVVFHLASWAEERRPLAQWLTEELHRRYGLARRLGRAWVADEQVLPLLDGLDEVAEEHRAACAEAINRFQAEHGQLPLVVCCRTGPYECLDVKLRLRGAVVIHPLTPAQVERYLGDIGDAAPDLQALVARDRQLRELLTTPLFLSIVVRTYSAEPSARPPPRGPLPERRRHVLVDYVEKMLARARAAPPAYAPAETVRWLAWLARAMRDRGQAVFYLDRMQPALLPSRPKRWLVTMAPSIAMVLAGCLAGVLDILLTSVLLAGHTDRLDVAAGIAGGGVRIVLPGQLANGVVAGAAVGLAAGLLAAVFTYERRIAPSTRLDWSWATIGRNLPRVLAAVLAAMCISLLVDRVLSGLAIHLIYGLLLVLLFKAFDPGSRQVAGRPSRLAAVFAVLLTAGVAAELLSGMPVKTLVYPLTARFVLGMSLGLMFGPETPLLETPPAPGQGIELSRRHGLAAGLLSGTLAALAFGTVVGVGVGRTMGVPAGIAVGLADGLSLGAIVGVGVSLRRGVGPYLRHVLLRGLLARGGAAPRDFAGFLDHAAGLILVRRRGGGYEFAHGLLLDHFADLRSWRETPADDRSPPALTRPAS
jgi:transcriptional regulator with XRE-family HTH domain